MNVLDRLSDIGTESDRDIVLSADSDTASASDTESNKLVTMSFDVVSDIDTESDRDLDGDLDRLSDSDTDSDSTALLLLVS